jgi:hypothetical protein
MKNPSKKLLKSNLAQSRRGAEEEKNALAFFCSAFLREKMFPGFSQKRGLPGHSTTVAF